jgi:hypothetical protein
VAVWCLGGVWAGRRVLARVSECATAALDLCADRSMLLAALLPGLTAQDARVGTMQNFID